MTGLADYAKRIKNIRDQVPGAADLAKKETAKAVLKALVTYTPVDTGQAISNWRVGIGRPEVETRGALAPGVKGSTAGANRSQAYEVGARLIDSAAPGQTVFISNHLPYIGRLNDGYSGQAPAGFVELAEQSGELTVKRVRLFK